MSNRPAGKWVLLVDDELGQREAIGLLLALDGHTVVQAANGQEALEHLGRESFDLVITDYSMPGMAGDELASNIKITAPALPIIMITGHSCVMKGAENPVDAVLTKPFELGDFRQTVASLLARARTMTVQKSGFDEDGSADQRAWFQEKRARAEAHMIQ